MTDVDEHASPPVDFPLYGLDWSFDSVRWLDFFEARNGSPAWAVWLGHRGAEDAGARIGTFPKRRYTEVMCPRGGDPCADVAFSAAFGLVNLTLPDSSVPRPEGLIPELVMHAEEQAKRYADWRTAVWHVDGAPIPASVWNFAGAWAGFSDSRADAFVVAIGIGVEPDELRLATVGEGHPYSVDLHAPLDLADLGRRRYERPQAWLPPPRRDGFHPDQLALVPEPQHG